MHPLNALLDEARRVLVVLSARSRARRAAASVTRVKRCSLLPGKRERLTHCGRRWPGFRPDGGPCGQPGRGLQTPEETSPRGQCVCVQRLVAGQSASSPLAGEQRVSTDRSMYMMVVPSSETWTTWLSKTCRTACQLSRRKRVGRGPESKSGGQVRRTLSYSVRGPVCAVAARVSLSTLG